MTTKDEALKLALSVLDEVRSETFRLLRNGQKLYAEEKVWNAIFVIKQALAEQPAQQQEPVAVVSSVVNSGEKGVRVRWLCGFPQIGDCLYTSPPNVPTARASKSRSDVKPWVGLTDEEMRDLEKKFNAERVRTSDEEYLIIYPGDYWDWQRAIEAKLREKNA